MVVQEYKKEEMKLSDVKKLNLDYWMVVLLITTGYAGLYQY